MKLQQVLSYVRRAIDDYHMIEDGDKIAIGISGGKDSLTLLYALHGLKRFYPKTFDIHAVTVDLGFQNVNLDKIKAICEDLNVEYTIVKTDIAKIILAIVFLLFLCLYNGLASLINFDNSSIIIFLYINYNEIFIILFILLY